MKGIVDGLRDPNYATSAKERAGTFIRTLRLDAVSSQS